MSDTAAVVLAVLLLAGNAFFVGAESALVSARRSAIEPLAEAGDRRARTTLRAMEQVSLMMAGSQLGITVCSLGLGAVAEPAVARQLERVFELVGLPPWLLHPLAFAIALAVVVAPHMVLGEMVPKNLAIAGPERSALLFGPPLVAVVRVLRPAIVALNAMANLLVRAAGAEPRDEVASTFTSDEVQGLITESEREGLLDRQDARLMRRAARFTDQDVADVLVPRDRPAHAAVGAHLEDLERVVAETGYSRFPVEDGAGSCSATSTPRTSSTWTRNPRTLRTPQNAYVCCPPSSRMHPSTRWCRSFRRPVLTWPPWSTPIAWSTAPSCSRTRWRRWWGRCVTGRTLGSGKVDRCTEDDDC